MTEAVLAPFIDLLPVLDLQTGPPLEEPGDNFNEELKVIEQNYLNHKEAIICGRLKWKLQKIIAKEAQTNSPDLCMISLAQNIINKQVHVLVEQNQGFTGFMATRYLDRGLELEDLKQTAQEGLIMAALKYNPDFEFDNGVDSPQVIRFSTYACGGIRLALLHALQTESRAIQLTSATMNLIKKVHFTEGELYQKSGRQPTLDEIAKSLNLKPEVIRRLMWHSQEILSLDDTIPLNIQGRNTPDNIVLGDAIKDPIQDTESLGVQQILRGQIMKILDNSTPNSLTPRERQVIKLLFDDQERTLKEVGDIFGLTRARVKQIKDIALTKLREMEEVQNLRDYLSPELKPLL